MRPIPIPAKFMVDPAAEPFFRELLADPTVTSIDDDYQVEVTDSTIIADTTLQAITATLPIVADAKHVTLAFKNAGSAANALTVDGDGADIDGNPTLAITDLGAATIVSDGTAWWVI